MTGNYAIMLPLMTAVVISTVISRALRHETIYTLKLLRRGVDIGQEEMVDVMRSVTVKEAMTRDFPTVPGAMKADEIVKLFRKTGHHGFPVVDEEGILTGVVIQTEVNRQLGAIPVKNKLTAGDIATKHPLVAYPDQTLDRLLDAVDEAEARIPVVSREAGRRLLGVIGRHEIIATYRKKARRRASLKRPPQVLSH
jgi:CIC family chloride channel protein